MSIKSYLIASILYVIVSIFSNAEIHEQLSDIEFKEPVSGVTFKIDASTMVESSRYDYRKALIYTDSTAISIWSVPNPDEQPFSWKKINEFDANNRFGVMTIQERIDKVDGWIRYYNYTDKQNKHWYYCVALVRGNTYALYLVESRLKTTKMDMPPMTIPQLISKTDFGEMDKRALNEKKSLEGDFWLIMFVGAFLSGLAKLFFRKQNGAFWTCGIITILIVIFMLYWILFYSISTVLLWSFLLICFWLLVWLSETWMDFYNLIVKALDKAT